MLKLFGNMEECKHNFSFSFVPVFNCCVVVLQLCGQVNSDGPERLRGGGGGAPCESGENTRQKI